MSQKLSLFEIPRKKSWCRLTVTNLSGRLKKHHKLGTFIQIEMKVYTYRHTWILSSAPLNIDINYWTTHTHIHINIHFHTNIEHWNWIQNPWKYRSKFHGMKRRAYASSAHVLMRKWLKIKFWGVRFLQLDETKTTTTITTTPNSWRWLKTQWCWWWWWWW